MAIRWQGHFRLDGAKELPGMRQSQGRVQGTINAGGYDRHLCAALAGPVSEWRNWTSTECFSTCREFTQQPSCKSTPALTARRGQSTIKFTFIDYLCERRIRPMLQLPSPGGNGLNAPNV